MKTIVPVLVGFSLALACAAGHAHETAKDVLKLSIERKSLRDALNDWAQQTGNQLIAEINGEFVAPKIDGKLTAQEALDQLLEGTPLTYQWMGERLVAVKEKSLVAPAALKTNREGKQQPFQVTRLSGAEPQEWRLAATDSAAQALGQGSARVSRDGESDLELEEILVTGTRIRGIRDTAAPSIGLSRADLESTGYSTVREVFKSLPQNLGEIGADVGYGMGNSQVASSNTQRAAGISLRGLGPGSTLVLLNGSRRPGNVNGRVFDISAIPLSVVERVDIVTGGRSAVYGSDAVAGVVNITTRTDFEGAETQAYFGAPSEAGGERLQFSQIVGRKFARGGFVAAYDYTRDWALDLAETDVIRAPSEFGIVPETLDVQPQDKRHSAFLAGQFEISDTVEFRGDALYTSSRNRALTHYGIPGVFDFSNLQATESDQWSTSAMVRVHMGKEWSLAFSGATGVVDNHETAVISSALSGSDTRARLSTMSAVADGPLLSFGDRTIRGAAGVERREERYTGENLDPAIVGENRSRAVNSAFAEVTLPIVQSGSHAGLRRLEFSAAGRHDDYSDFGSTFNPQFGVIWGPSRDLVIKGTYSEAFRAPDLYYMALAQQGAIWDLPDPEAASGVSPVLVWADGNPNLRPETAETWTAGFDFTPEAMPSTRLALSYFNIRYANRIDQTNPAFFDTLQNEASYVGYVTRTPSESQIAAVVNSDPNGIFSASSTPFDPATEDVLTVFPDIVLFDDRFNNIGRLTVTGLDLQANTAVDVAGGELSFGVNAVYYLDADRQVTRTSPILVDLNKPGRPVDMRARAFAGWSRRALDVHAFLNYVDSYDDTIAVPSSRIEAWTTVDLSVQLDGTQLAPSTWLDGLTVTIGLLNAFDQKPPKFLSNDIGIGYDPTNANPLGRFASLRIAKRW